ncbi:MAG: YceI family protein [Cyclobacteriaceae bacterium]|nr:YceI family protein [Cyclobacteriaceae bacterium]MDH4296061.1 YceI family protein [Cyclobacteriaceae bacterium]MDH5248331.1 YceI family protein [Cyclobacteriaceae bacterium]
MIRNSKLIVLLLLTAATAFGQTAYKCDIKNSKLTVQGTSTLHDWESVAESYTANATAADGSLKDVSLVVKVNSIKSGKSGMDKNTYSALNADAHPTITFKAKQLTISGTTIKGEGQLTIAGKTKTIPVTFNYEQWTPDSYQVTGDVKLIMTEYGVKPPVAMLGTIKTGDEVTIHAELNMIK